VAQSPVIRSFKFRISEMPNRHAMSVCFRQNLIVPVGNSTGMIASCGFRLNAWHAGLVGEKHTTRAVNSPKVEASDKG